MRDHMFGIAVGTLLAAGAASAQVTSIDSVDVQERRFNDFPTSTLVTTNNYPSLVRFDESNFGAGGFANQHMAWYATGGGASRYTFQNNEAFTASVDVTLEVGSFAPRKEAGFRFDSFIGGESFFQITSDGEVAAFGGPFPFFSFGASAYTLGTAATLGIIYTPDDDADPTDGDAATIEYLFNGMSSGVLNFGNTENGFINGTQGGYKAQFQVDTSRPDFAIASFANGSIIPAPTAAAGLGLALGLMGLRRRR